MIEKLSVVIPCYNEKASIPLVVPRLFDSLNELKSQQEIQDYEIIVVNDQSTDGSLELLETFDNLNVVTTRGQKRGYGSALKEGFSTARGDWLCFLDMDNTYRPEDLPKFIESSKGGNDFIMGVRGLSEDGMSFTRGLGNWVYGTMAKMFYGSHLSDVCSGYRLFHKRHLPIVQSIREDGLDFSIFLTLKLILQKIKITPIAIQYDSRIGESKLSVLSDGLAFLKVLMTIKARKSREFEHSQI